METYFTSLIHFLPMC